MLINCIIIIPLEIGVDASIIIVILVSWYNAEAV